MVQEQLVRIDLSENDVDGAIKDGENALLSRISLTRHG
jgi:hypothetical protein